MKKFFQEKQLKKDEEEFAKVTSAIQRMQDYDRDTARCAIHSMETQNQCMRDDIETLDEHYQFMMTKEVQYLRLIEAKTYHWNKYPNSGPYCTDITFNKYV
uniref:Uncharacterized protein n=1 Tax=Cacopsylla melanoneura TaxID=428564 RepID=A0A8D8QTI0_9HEMI